MEEKSKPKISCKYLEAIAEQELILIESMDAKFKPKKIFIRGADVGSLIYFRNYLSARLGDELEVSIGVGKCMNSYLIDLSYYF